MLKILPLLLLSLPLAAQQLEIVEATYGVGNFQMDVAQKLRGLIQNNALDVAADPAILGGDPSPGNPKRLRVLYRFGGQQLEAFAADFERIRIPAAGFSLGDLWGNAATVSSLRIVSARYGQGARFNDVRERLQGLVRNDALSVAVTNVAMGGDPAPATAKTLEVSYEYRGAAYQTSVKEGATLVLPAAAEAPAPKVLRIVSARYGEGARFNDVRDRVQALVRDNTLSLKVDNAPLGGDPAVGKDKVLEVTYEWTGAVYAASAREGRTLSLPDPAAKPVSTAVPVPSAPAPSNTGTLRPANLRIFYARYGVPGREVDVRDRLRPLLQNDSLSTVVGASSMGADPAPNVAKTLTVLYEIRGRTFEKTAADGQSLVLP
jgi:hypothetical protein